jgi:hypothetical protein
MDIISIQKKLSELGLLDPPADGTWGPVSSWALGVVMGGPVQTEAITSQAVEDKLLAAQPLPLNPGTDLPSLMVKAAIARGAWICRHPKCSNLIYAEGTDLDGSDNGDPPNHFAAIRTLIVIGTDGIPRFAPAPGGGVAKWIATTEPSRWWTENPMSDLGAARLTLGQHLGKWAPGQYHNGPALMQVRDTTVQRDPNATYKRYGKIYTGNFGIEHHADYGYPRNNQGRSSAGCCVALSSDGHFNQFVPLYLADVRYRASHGYLFSATILTHADLVAQQPAKKGTTSLAQVVPVPPDARSPRHDNIWMTVFAGLSKADGGYDPEDSAYTGARIDPKKVGFSVSYHFSEPRPWVRAWNGSKTVDGPLVDVGPGLTHDPWFDDPHGQPGANNHAGLDATPAAWRALGLDPRDGKVRISMQLIKPPALAAWKPKAKQTNDDEDDA